MLEAWVSRICAVGDPELRAHQLVLDLTRLSADCAVELLAEAQARAGSGDASMGVFMQALQDALAHDLLSYERKVELYKAAALVGLLSVQRLILAPPARQSKTIHGKGRAPEGQETLGMRTWNARRAPRGQQLDRLVRDADPRVIRNLLLNPHLTEKDVLSIVTRRPVPADVLREVAASDRWNRRAAVRRALVFNPFTPTEIALRLLPLLSRPDLHALAVDAKIHAEVAQQAAVFAKERPPTRNPPSARGRSHTRVAGGAANDDLEMDPPTLRDRGE